MDPENPIPMPHPKLSSSLRKLRHAQELVFEAAADLSAVPGFTDEWTDLCKLFDAVKAQQQRIDDKRQELR